MEFTKVMATRKSTRKYEEHQISTNELETVLLAGSSAAIGNGAYDSLHFTVVQNKEILNKISVTTAKAMGNTKMNPLYNVPTLVIVSATKSEHPGAEMANAGCAIQNMLLTATDINLGSVYLMGFLLAFKEAPELVSELNLPEGFAPISGVGLGYPVEPLVERDLKMKIKVNRIS